MIEDANGPRVDLCRPILEFLSTLAPDDSLKNPLHVVVSVDMANHFARLVQGAPVESDVRPPKSIAYKIFTWDVTLDRENNLADLLPLQPVIVFDDDPEPFPPESSRCSRYDYFVVLANDTAPNPTDCS
jgi:hypothetical protein